MTGATVSKSLASDIIDDWANIKTPPAPELKAVTVDPKTTALFMGDLVNQVCGKRPRCVAALPAIKKLLGEACAAKVAVIYSIVPNTTPADIMPDVAPAADEPSVQSGVDKFFKTNLEQILKDKGTQTIIMVGTSAEGPHHLYWRRSSIARIQRYHSSGRSGVGGSICGAICDLAHDPRTNRLAQGDADEDRHDKVLGCGLINAPPAMPVDASWKLW